MAIEKDGPAMGRGMLERFSNEDAKLTASIKVGNTVFRKGVSISAAQRGIDRLWARCKHLQPIADAWDECAGEIGDSETASFKTEQEWAAALVAAIVRNIHK